MEACEEERHPGWNCALEGILMPLLLMDGRRDWGQGNRLEKVMETCAVWSGWEGKQGVVGIRNDKVGTPKPQGGRKLGWTTCLDGHRKLGSSILQRSHLFWSCICRPLS